LLAFCLALGFGEGSDAVLRILNFFAFQKFCDSQDLKARVLAGEVLRLLEACRRSLRQHGLGRLAQRNARAENSIEAAGKP
jgi:hypothetical protein